MSICVVIMVDLHVEISLNYQQYSTFRNFQRSNFLFTLKIVMKDGKSLGYGIIEYKSWQEAEKSERHLNSHKILDVPMRITYCIPGISAVTICSRLMSKFVSTYVLLYQYIRHGQTEASKVKFCLRLSENERITMYQQSGGLLKSQKLLILFYKNCIMLLVSLKATTQANYLFKKSIHLP